MSDFFNGNVLVAGNGISGTGAKEALARLGMSVSTFCDGESFEQKEYSAIVLSPSFDKSHFLYEYAKRNGIPIIGEYQLGCALNTKPLVAVTGTNGKTTVVSMLGDIFSQSKNTAVCGNIGVSFSALASENNYDVAITEVSSFQLEQTTYMRPNVAVITNVTPDHLDRHKTMEEYARLKFSIASHQTKDDWLVLPADSQLYDLTLLSTQARVVYVSTKQKTNGAYVLDNKIYYLGEEIAPLPKADYLKAPHNIENALFAVAVSKIFGIANTDIITALSSYKPQKHRVELVNRINGVSFYDDSKSTNTDSVKKALACMRGSVVLIMGGSEKGLDYSELFKKVDNVLGICVIGEIADSIISTAKRSGFTDIQKFETLEQAVANAFLLSPDNVLLSPGSASYGMFSSYKERGEKFREAVKKIADGKI